MFNFFKKPKPIQNDVVKLDMDRIPKHRNHYGWKWPMGKRKKSSKDHGT